MGIAVLSGNEAASARPSLFTLPEAKGYVLTYLPRGIAQIAVPLFVVPSVLDMCKMHPPGWNLSCTNIPLILAVVAIAVLILLTPVVGATCEYTSKRKEIARGLNVSFCFTLLALVAFGNNSWQFMVFLAMAHGPVVELAHEAVNTYLPEISPLAADRVTLSSTGLLLYVFASVGFGVVVAVLSANVDMFSSATGIVRLTAVLGFVLALPLVLFSQSKLERRPAAKPLEPGSHLAVQAWKYTVADVRSVRRESPAVFKYLRARAFYIGANRQVAFTATLYIKVVVMANPQVPVLMAFALGGVGAMLGILARHWVRNLKWVTAASVASLVVVNAVMPFVYYSHNQLYMGPVYGVLWGLTIGLTTCVDRAMFASIVPAKQEAVLFGLFHFSNSILEWMPPLLFAVVQAAAGNIRYAPLATSAMMAVGLVLLCPIDIDAAREKADGQWDSRRVSKYVSAHSAATSALDTDVGGGSGSGGSDDGYDLKAASLDTCMSGTGRTNVTIEDASQRDVEAVDGASLAGAAPAATGRAPPV